jgi:hypothetical protein
VTTGWTRTGVVGRWVLALATSAGCWAPAAAAQSSFAWPDTTVDLSTYTTVEQCLALTDRVRAGITEREARDPAIGARDTMPWRPSEVLEPAPRPVVAAADQCVSRLGTPATVSLSDYLPFMQLYLVADRDRDAAALLARRLAANPSGKAADRAAITDSAVRVYLGARPLRLAPAESIMVERARSGTDRVQRLKAYLNIMLACATAGDSVRMRRAAEHVVAVHDSLSSADRESEAFEKLNATGLNTSLFFALRALVGDKEELESLRRGTEAYASLLRRTWATVLKMRPESFPVPIGERAAPIQAAVWFRRYDAKQPLPTPGRVALVVFLDSERCTTYSPIANGDLITEGLSCYPTAAALRRLAARFANLQIILVAPTHGYFMFGPPVAAAEEASLIDRWTDAHRLRFPLAVTETPFLRVAAPDGRRIDRPDSNVIRYSFGKMLTPSQVQSFAFLVDQNGQVVQTYSPFGLGEAEFAKLIDVLLHRPQGGV